jgi:DNA-binding winged helix-turn-helix (wHTH) protein
VISVSLLGPVEVRRDGEVIAVPSGKPTELLMRLAVAAGTTVPKERLVEDLWAADAVSTTANTMQSKVSRLRRALGDPALVEGGQVGYKLAVDPSAVDVLELADAPTTSRDFATPVTGRGCGIGAPMRSCCFGGTACSVPATPTGSARIGHRPRLCACVWSRISSAPGSNWALPATSSTNCRSW